jgi:hypothetical protein
VQKISEKKKIEYDLSQNLNIKKIRNKLINFISLKKELELRENANRQTIDRSVRVLKRTIEYELTTKKNKIRMIQKIKKNIVAKR